MASCRCSNFARSFGRSTFHSTLLLLVLGALLCDEKRGRGGNGSSVGHGDRCYSFLSLVYEAPTILRLHHQVIDSSSGSCGKSGNGSEILLL